MIVCKTSECDCAECVCSECKNDCKHMHEINARQLTFSDISASKRTTYLCDLHKYTKGSYSSVNVIACKLSQTHSDSHKCSQSHVHASAIKQTKTCTCVAAWAIFSFKRIQTLRV